MHLRKPCPRTLWIAIAAIVLVALLTLSLIYRARIKLGWTVLLDETGSQSAAITCLILGLFTLASLLCWMVFPLVFYLGLKDLRRRTSDLDETLRSCARAFQQLEDRPRSNPAQSLPRPGAPTSPHDRAP